jgi:predicted RNA binding protein YcfA (HicA-like mRNA interferase family)
MPRFGPIKRRELVQCLCQFGFHGPFAGGKHQFMVKSGLRVRILNPHREDIGRNLLGGILREAGIEISEWEEL